VRNEGFASSIVLFFFLNFAFVFIVLNLPLLVNFFNLFVLLFLFLVFFLLCGVCGFVLASQPGEADAATLFRLAELIAIAVYGKIELRSVTKAKKRPATNTTTQWAMQARRQQRQTFSKPNMDVSHDKRFIENASKATIVAQARWRTRKKSRWR